jgi:hypothetical protein
MIAVKQQNATTNGTYAVMSYATEDVSPAPDGIVVNIARPT